MKRVAILCVLALPGCAPNKTPSPTPRSTDRAPAPAGATFIQYKWSGGLSQYSWYLMTIEGTDTAKVDFLVKPARSAEKHAEDTLDAAQFTALKELFDKVGFDTLKTKPRGARVLDMGQTILSREGGGKPTTAIRQNGNTEIDGDMKPLNDWLDLHVQMYLEKSGARSQTK